MDTQHLFELTGRRAVVTGASRGIGRAIALGYADRGADVLAVARTEDGLRETVELAEGSSGSIRYLPVDLLEPNAARDVVDHAVTTLGGIDILVNNAADDQSATIEDLELEKFQRIIALNLEACWLLCREASAALADGDGGVVVNVASVTSFVGFRDASAYVAAKHGLMGVTRALALEWARRGVRVNALAPGFVDTAINFDGLSNERTIRAILRNTPQNRWVEPEEMVGPAIYLASPASSFMTGQALVVDGGWLAR